MSSRSKDLAQLLARGEHNATQDGPMVTTPAAKTTPSSKAATKKATPVRPTKATPAPATSPAAAQEQGAMVRAATLIPTELHKEISARSDGTFGQLITWSCQDFADAIVEDVLESLGAGAQISRAPRVNRGAAPKGATRQIAPTFLPAENVVVLELLERIKQRAVETGLDPVAVRKITRTVLHIAALKRWATEHPDSTD